MNQYEENDPTMIDNTVNLNQTARSNMDVDEPIIIPEQKVIPQVKQAIEDTRYYEAFTPVQESKLSPINVTQRLPNTLITDEDLESCYNLCQQMLNDSKNDVAQRTSLEDVLNAFYNIAMNTYPGSYQSFFDRNVDSLTQYVVGQKGVAIRISYPKINFGTDNDTISGKMALQYVKKITRTGNVTKIPLWHSGLTVTIDPFSERELHELVMAMERHQINIGSETRGASFTGEDIHVVGLQIELILSHVVDCSLKSFNKTNLRKLINVNDIPALQAGALAAIYPMGYPTLHTCVAITDKGICNYNLTTKKDELGGFYPDTLLDFTKIYWVDKTHLSVDDSMYLSSGPRTLTYEEIKDYQKRLLNKVVGSHNKAVIWEHDFGNGNTKYTFGFKVPTLMEYSVSANAWVANVSKMTEDALAEEPDNYSNEPNMSKAERQAINKQREIKRSKILQQYVVITDLVKHLGWIDYIEITDEDNTTKIISDEDTIKSCLLEFVTLDGFKESLEKEIQKFKEWSIIAWSGIPNWECPMCGHGQTDPNSPRPSLIPINLSGYFFSTMVWRKEMMNL